MILFIFFPGKSCVIPIFVGLEDCTVQLLLQFLVATVPRIGVENVDVGSGASLPYLFCLELSEIVSISFS